MLNLILLLAPAARDLPTAPPPRPVVDVAALVRQLGSEDYPQRERATEQLLGRGFDAPPPELLAALTSANPEARARAGRVVADIRGRAADRLLTRGAAFARAGRVDLFAASTAAWDLPAGSDRLWRPFFELGGEVSARGRRAWPIGANGRKDFDAFVSRATPTFTRVPDVYRPERIVGRQFGPGRAVGVMAGGFDCPSVILESVVLSRGAVSTTNSVRESVIVANGNVTVADDATHAVIVADGDVEIKLLTRNVVVVARGDIKLFTAHDATLIAGGKVVLAKPAPPGANPNNIIEEGATKPLDFVTFFELSAVGVKAEAAGKDVRVAAVADGGAFAKAGAKVGDVVAEVGGKKPDSPEALRRLLRDALALGDARVSLVRDGKPVAATVALPE